MDGTGKTTVAKALCNELGCDVMMINGSDEGRSIDVVRNQIKNFDQRYLYMRVIKLKWLLLMRQII